MKPDYNFTGTGPEVTVDDSLQPANRGDIIDEILNGLTAHPKYIASKYFYNKYGSKLFEEITRLPEYYPTWTEKSVLRGIAPQLSARLKNMDIFELGSGDCSKISIVLEAIPRENRAAIRYIPVDVSHSALIGSTNLLEAKFPEISINGLVADFMKGLEFIPGNSKKLICFFGSTIGNLSRQQSTAFLLELSEVMGPGDEALIGFDMVKDIHILENAYNDKQGITEAFNKNILRVVNHYAGTSFDPEWFEHHAFYNRERERVEMHLKATADIEVHCPHLPEKIRLKKGETIHTENSHKFRVEHIEEFSAITGLALKDIYTDSNNWFSVAHYQA